MNECMHEWTNTVFKNSDDDAAVGNVQLLHTVVNKNN